jgi:hypothetical protein
MIISVSRRCDIPRFQFAAFLERLDAGFADAANPFNAAQVRRVSLLPEDVDALVFWTRDPRSILDHAGELEARGYRFYVMTTLTAYPAALEPDMPPEEGVIAALRGLAEKLGPRRVIWRYDPILLSTITGREWHIRNFRRLAGALEGAAERVIISLYDEYPAARRRIGRLEKAGAFKTLPLADGEGRPLPESRELLAALAAAAAGAGLSMYACAEAEDLRPLGIARGACVDGELIKALWGIEAGGKDKNQRPRCGCVPSVDIGRYGRCPAACVYCYARRG